ncbi:tRNA methyltransferase ppm2 [Diaporthe australafricana]|uniref:tRNA wybutosine-synthesizing protein 4 n=1 Tax=Diaporthe australafricana TaxID=127596 RepID=A0ABR3VYU7_9PEZI
MGARTDKGRSAASGLHLPRATAQDDLVMGTNNSSIVSKRSVERLYYPDEPHFFRFFVKKFQRRAPLINRGYHLRLHVIDVTLRNFLKQPSEKTKVIVNLGCGSQSQAVFVDVDFADLARRKRQVVLATPELESQLSEVHAEEHEAFPNVLLRSKRYHLVGCDLRQSMALQQALSLLVDPQKCIFLFLAEVSITYMETESADSLIQWASSLGQAEFCLLEQILPDGPDHPFARTMMDHFNKLSTPIKSVTTYPDVPTQCARFAGRGWSGVQAQSLWSAWNDDHFLSADDRRKLDEVEPFDEWEEFCLFASHYLILHATNYGKEGVNPCLADNSSDTLATEFPTSYKPLSGQHGLRRFGAAMLASDALGRTSILNCLGLGHTTRLPSYDIYKLHGSGGDIKMKSEGPSSRMCHSLTDLGTHGTLLVGGRNSPSRAKNDCWLFKKDSHQWKRTQDLPIPLYRHAVCGLSDSSVALLVGGKSGATGVSSEAMVFNPYKGWLRCEVLGSLTPVPAFGAMLTCSEREQKDIPTFHGFLIGGISDGVIQNRVLAWTLALHDDKAPSITFTTAEIDETSSKFLARFGASCIQQEDSLVVLGGVGHMGLIPQRQEILLCSVSGSKIEVSVSGTANGHETPRPLIVGSSIVSPRSGQIVILGGGATCFSMGSFWTRGSYTISIDEISYGIPSRPLPRLIGWGFSGSGEIEPRPSNAQESESKQAAQAKPTPRVNVGSKESFDDIVRKGSPVVIEGLDLGACHGKWTIDFLAGQVGDRKVVVHACDVRNMDFNAKNFRYTTMTFADFAEEVRNGARFYLRALSADAPADQPANLARDFPSLADDFRLPEALNTCAENLHSSVLRVSGQLDMWLHYDVQANIYCQIGGSKRMLLFPPSDVVRMAFAPGASSSSIDVFGCLDSPALQGTHPWEAELKAGDVLFLPPLWLHTATPTSNTSIAVNVFFRNLDSGYSAGRDVYGNRDLAAYEKGRQEIARISKAFDRVPVEAKQFYMLRLAGELAEAAQGDN